MGVDTVVAEVVEGFLGSGGFRGLQVAESLKDSLG
jgi:hypothetical protein